jgi:hypothetical protein
MTEMCTLYERKRIRGKSERVKCIDTEKKHMNMTFSSVRDILLHTGLQVEDDPGLSRKAPSQKHQRPSGDLQDGTVAYQTHEEMSSLS